MTKRKTAKRKNEGKPKLGYILHMPAAIKDMADVLEFGESKYGPASDKGWLGYDTDEIIDSLMRHLEARQRGETHDPETGLRVEAHIIANAAFLCENTSPS